MFEPKPQPLPAGSPNQDTQTPTGSTLNNTPIPGIPAAYDNINSNNGAGNADHG